MRWVRAALVGLLVSALGGCGGGDDARTAQRREPGQIVIQDSVTIFSSLGELADAAQAVVVFTATDERSEDEIDGLPFTMTTVRIEEVLRGAYPQATMAFRQAGDISGRTKIADGPALVSPGRRYLAFVLESFAHDPRRDHWWGAVDGGVGLYEHVEGDRYRRAMVDGNPLPLEATFDEIRAQVRSASG